jgi:hypothetical protein
VTFGAAVSRVLDITDSLRRGRAGASHPVIPARVPRHRVLSCPRDGRRTVPGVRRGAASRAAGGDGRRAGRIPGGGHPAAGQRLGFLALLPGAVRSGRPEVARLARRDLPDRRLGWRGVQRRCLAARGRQAGRRALPGPGRRRASSRRGARGKIPRRAAAVSPSGRADLHRGRRTRRACRAARRAALARRLPGQAPCHGAPRLAGGRAAYPWLCAGRVR